MTPATFVPSPPLGFALLPVPRCVPLTLGSTTSVGLTYRLLASPPNQWCQFKTSLAVETATTQAKTTYTGYKTPDSSIVRAGGLRSYSREFHSLGLKLTLMSPIPPIPGGDKSSSPQGGKEALPQLSLRSVEFIFKDTSGLDITVENREVDLQVEPTGGIR